ncbi:MAG: hypothetical protein AVDCRST_MAG12-252, partial [uncultured Rubrobacteraceae bacterium]
APAACGRCRDADAFPRAPFPDPGGQLAPDG